MSSRLKQLRTWFFSVFAHLAICYLCVDLFIVPAENQEKSPNKVYGAGIILKEAEPTKVPHNLPVPAKVSLSSSRAKKTGHNIPPTDRAQANSVEAGEGARKDELPVVPVIVRLKPMLTNADRVQVPYPLKARVHRVEGSVLLKLKIDQFGEVSASDVLRGPAFGLRQAALSLAQKFRFLPATDEHGHPLVSEVEHEVIFRLRED